MDNENQHQKEEKKEKPLNELLTSKIVDIYVGAESTHWPLHERLLCYHSKFFSNVLYKDENTKGNKSYGLPDEDDYPFELLVGWLYSRAIREPKSEKDVGPLLDLYLLSQKFEMDKLASDVVDTVREWYHSSNTYPGLRRVQYIYSETDEDNEMRELMVSSIARQLTTTDGIQAHWAKALQRNGQLAVDIIRSIQQWHIEEKSIPDVRDADSERGRQAKGFSAVEREGAESTETTDTNLGVQSIQSESEATQPNHTGEELDSARLKLDAKRNEPPDKLVLVGGHADRKGFSRNFSLSRSASRPENVFLALAWVAYFGYNILQYGKLVQG